MDKFGVWYYRNYGKVLQSPLFTPMILFGVKDLDGYIREEQTPSPKSINTNVPADKKCTVFYRCTATDSTWRKQFSLYRLQVIDGFWHVVFQSRPVPIRLYIFANIESPIPEYGIYFYRDGEIFYHQNCLPLSVKISNRFTASPVRVKAAVLPCVLETEQPDQWIVQVILGAGYYYFGTTDGYQWGIKEELYDVDKLGFQPQFRPGRITTYAYIETAIYDQYYKQSLGYK
ncbi:MULTISPECIES: hypothetical protein [Pectobacterium]|uniref:hypothetical protein n=1 Tax=Pectobacterium TaxID=122277 RepID=UPI0011D18AB7|nr:MULTISPECIES: hypothetical protein [Pectobacterium]MBN3207153.1 hypothetical protein [Pectobacterium brasiliense]QRN32606.1 hypothetical protein IHJ54_11350 [Pectobacterium brasiliense]UPY96997.1 hypothetical protein MYB54_10025 [Pectobacterium sp. 21LCBS03]